MKLKGIVVPEAHLEGEIGVGNITVGGGDSSESDTQLKELLEGTLTDLYNEDATYIGERVFYYDTTLKSVDLPNVTSVGKESFASSNIESANLENVTSLGYYAFGDCKSLSSINMPNAQTIDYYAFGNCSGLNCSINLPSLESMGAYAFSNSYITEILAPNLTELETDTGRQFMSCGYLQNAYLPKAKSLPQYAFYYNTALTFSEDSFLEAESIGYNCFYNCSNITEAYFPKATSIADYAFDYCSKLSKFEAHNVTTVGKYALRNNLIETIDFPLLESMGDECFYGCSSLTSFNAPLLTGVPQRAFYNCQALTTVNIPSVTYLDISAFWSCYALRYLKLDNVSYIGSEALSSCTSLEALVLPYEGVCMLANQYILSGSKIGDGGGYIYVPSAYVESYKSHAYWSTYADQFRAIEDYPDILTQPIE